jgi:hypothetical protein
MLALRSYNARITKLQYVAKPCSSSGGHGIRHAWNLARRAVMHSSSGGHGIRHVGLARRAVMHSNHESCTIRTDLKMIEIIPNPRRRICDTMPEDRSMVLFFCFQDSSLRFSILGILKGEHNDHCRDQYIRLLLAA